MRTPNPTGHAAVPAAADDDGQTLHRAWGPHTGALNCGLRVLTSLGSAYSTASLVAVIMQRKFVQQWWCGSRQDMLWEPVDSIEHESIKGQARTSTETTR